MSILTRASLLALAKSIYCVYFVDNLRRILLISANCDRTTPCPLYKGWNNLQHTRIAAIFASWNFFYCF